MMEKERILREIPPVNEILEDEAVSVYLGLVGRRKAIEILRRVIEAFRQTIKGSTEPEYVDLYNNKRSIHNELVRAWIEEMEDEKQSTLKPLINATGVVLHTNFGRAPLPEKVMDQVREIVTGYSNLEYDLAKGTRGSRYHHVEKLLCELTGAEAAMIVNNNAAAVFLCLHAFALGKEVIVSRGEQVEIGGQFRVPEIIEESGCILKEVGTTNKTHVRDYLKALSPETSMILKVHTSNYKMIGFVSSVRLSEIDLPEEASHIVKMEDLGSGCFMDLDFLGAEHEKTPSECLKEGADLVTFSGDKLLGGPQAGIIVGKKRLLDQLKNNPLARILRCDKMTIAAMNGILALYATAAPEYPELPIWNMLRADEVFLEGQALKLRETLLKHGPETMECSLLDVEEEVGGGALPGVLLKGKAVAVKIHQVSAEEVRGKLRVGQLPIVCRVKEGRLLFHVRTLQESDFERIGIILGKVMGVQA